jgi:hypothetical protein
MTNLNRVIFLFLILIFQTSCSVLQKSKPTDGKNNPKKCVKMLHPISQTNILIKKEDIFCYEGEVFYSVGKEITYEINNQDIVKLDDTQIRYKNEDAVKKGLSGADAATITIAFRAMSRGETTVIIKEMFRGEVKNIYEFKITIE